MAYLYCNGLLPAIQKTNYPFFRYPVEDNNYKLLRRLWHPDLPRKEFEKELRTILKRLPDFIKGEKLSAEQKAQILFEHQPVKLLLSTSPNFSQLI